MNKLLELSKEKSEKIGKDFLIKYLETGFGIMTKSNMETLLFYLMQKEGFFNGMTNFQIGSLLRISEERVSKLSYSAQLMYAEHDDDNERLRAVLAKALPKADGKKIQFSIEDGYLRKLLRSKIREQNNFSDGSFSSDIVTVDIDTYVTLLESLFYNKQEECADIVTKCKNEIPKHLLSKYPEGDITFHWMLKTTIEGACSEIGKVGIDNIASFFDGVTMAKNAVDAFKKIFNHLTDKYI